jgi:hypothetical protein
MTIPLERSLAVLWAGGLLIRLNGDRRVPIELRRIATSIARHFPTIEDVEHAATLSLLGDHGGMFEHPRNCPNWQEKCPGPPLTHRTRLNWPSHGDDDGVSDKVNPADDANYTTATDDLANHLVSVEHARQVFLERAKRLLVSVASRHPTIAEALSKLGLSEEQAAEWLLRPAFDDRTKNAAQLLVEDRCCDVHDRIMRLIAGHY